MHSNAGIIVSGANNDVSGTVTFDDENCGFEPQPPGGNGHTGGLDAPTHAGSIADPAFAAPTAAECTFSWTGSGDIDLHTQDGGPGELDVWADSDTLKTGNYCHLGTGKLQQSRQFGNGTVSFFANGYIDLSAGSNVNYTPFRADGVLTHSLANSPDGVTLAGQNSVYAGIVYVPNGEAEAGGSNNQIGCLVGETVKIDGSLNTIGTNCEGTPPEPPVLEILKVNNTGGEPVNPTDPVNFTITVNVTNGPAENSFIEDFLPDGYDTPPTNISDGGVFNEVNNSIQWGPLTVTDGDTFTYTATVSADTTEADSPLVNNVFITSPGTNCPGLVLTGVDVDDPCHADSTVIVEVPEEPDPVISIEKTNSTEGPPQTTVEPGDPVNFTITVSVTNGPAEGAIIVDELPDGYDAPTVISDSGVYDEGDPSVSGDETITWGPLTVANGDTFTYTAAVSADTTEADSPLVNRVTITSPGTNCPPLDQKELFGTQGDDPCEDDSIVIVDIPPLEPALLVDKVADTETITISGPANAPVATPSVVTWTLTYTVTNGPVHNAVITDEVPEGFVFLDASVPGTEADGVVTWELGTLTTGGSVSFRTTVDPETIDRVNPTENVAVIDSDETEPDEGEDSVTVTVVAPPLGGNPTPSGSVPDTAFGFGLGGETISVPLELLAIAFIGSLGALTVANVRAWNRRR